MRSRSGIDVLLDLHGQIIDQGKGYWIKIEAWRALPSRAVPHGIRYSLTLHNPYGKRILGYDNAHAVSAPRKARYKGRIVAHDHKHRGRADKGVPYEFQDAYQLLADFFGDVDRVLGQVGK